jgi:uncharacterized protein YcfL
MKTIMTICAAALLLATGCRSPKDNDANVNQGMNSSDQGQTTAPNHPAQTQ